VTFGVARWDVHDSLISRDFFRRHGQTIKVLDCSPSQSKISLTSVASCSAVEHLILHHCLLPQLIAISQTSPFNALKRLDIHVRRHSLLPLDPDDFFGDFTESMSVFIPEFLALQQSFPRLKLLRLADTDCHAIENMKWEWEDRELWDEWINRCEETAVRLVDCRGTLISLDSRKKSEVKSG
jgi:hypothetical protein